MPGAQRIQYLARGKKLAPSCEAFSAPGARAVRGLRPEKPITGTDMKNSPYLDKPLVSLAVALLRLLERVAVDLTTAGPADARRLRQRAHLILDLLTPGPTDPRST